MAEEAITSEQIQTEDDPSLKRDLETILRNFQDAYDQSYDERKLAERCRDYYDGFQWTEDEIKTLRERKQPVITSNHIFPKVNALIGYEKLRRTDPKAYPRTPKHEQDAESATDALRYVSDKNSFDELRSDVTESVIIEGCAAVTVGVTRSDDDNPEVKINMVSWDRFYRDPHSRRRDFLDAKFMGVVVWMDEDDALNRWKGEAAEKIIKGAYNNSSLTVGEDTYDDRPKLTWGDENRKRIRVLQHRWIKDGKWHTAIACRGGFLSRPQVSPYLDENKKPACDIHAVSAFVSRENWRLGAVHQILSPQDEINKRRSKALHRLSVTQVIADHGAVKDVSHAKKELAKPDGWIEKNPNMAFEVRDGIAEMQGEMQLLSAAISEINATGPSPSLEGDRAAPSGRAQELQQGAALQEQSIIFDSIKHWSWRVYKAIWCCVRQYWTAEQWIRVTDNEGNLKWVGLNRQVTVQEEVQQLMTNGQPVPEQLQAMMMVNPNMPTRVENPVAELDVDIIVEDGPDTVTVQAEQFTQLIELAKNSPPGTIPVEMIIEASNLRNKDRILEHLKSGGIPPQVQQQMQELQQTVQELAQKLQQSEQNNQSEQINAQAKIMDSETKQYDAVTKRITATKPEVSVGFDVNRSVQ